MGKGSSYDIGDIIGHMQILGYETSHSKTITAESDGIIVAMRIIDFLVMERQGLKNRVMNRMMEVYANEVLTK